jgi:hypothetical protein
MSQDGIPTFSHLFFLLLKQCCWNPWNGCSGKVWWWVMFLIYAIATDSLITCIIVCMQYAIRVFVFDDYLTDIHHDHEFDRRCQGQLWILVHFPRRWKEGCPLISSLGCEEGMEIGVEPEPETNQKSLVFRRILSECWLPWLCETRMNVG